MKINAYLNDTSLSFNNKNDWTIRFDHIVSCLKVLSDIPKDSLSLVIHPKIFLEIVIQPNEKLTDFLQKHKERKKSFTSVLNKAIKKYLYFDSEGKYFVHSMDVSNSSIADAYESRKLKNETIIINFNMNFPIPIVEINKKDDNMQEVQSFNCFDDLTKKLKELELIREYYDKDSNLRPNESLTILSDSSLFTPTKFGNRGNRLYSRIDNEDELWCLDRNHRGRSSHLEVFSKSQKKQIAISCIDEIKFFRDLTKEEKNRRLEIEPMP